MDKRCAAGSIGLHTADGRRQATDVHQEKDEEDKTIKSPSPLLLKSSSDEDEDEEFNDANDDLSQLMEGRLEEENELVVSEEDVDNMTDDDIQVEDVNNKYDDNEEEEEDEDELIVEEEEPDELLILEELESIPGIPPTTSNSRNSLPTSVAHQMIPEQPYTILSTSVELGGTIADVEDLNLLPTIPEESYDNPSSPDSVTPAPDSSVGWANPALATQYLQFLTLFTSVNNLSFVMTLCDKS